MADTSACRESYLEEFVNNPGAAPREKHVIVPSLMQELGNLSKRKNGPKRFD
jgi:hypothetical protein